MTVGIAGLGLIGGSLARAFRQSGVTVYGFDRDKVIQDFAKLQGTLSDILTEENVKDCDLLMVALYPDAAIAYLREMAPHIPETTLVMDCCGTKRKVCDAIFPLAEGYGFTFVGGPPMAGTQYSGYANSKADMFQGASLLIVPPRTDDIRLLARIKVLLSPAGFGHFTVTTAAHHDEMIAYTSQMCHVLSNAYVKSPRAQEHRGFSAGSYQDLTRVAWLNEEMWSELFLENRDYLIEELDRIMGYLDEYRQALTDNDRETMRELLAYGRKCKEKVDAV